MAKLSTLLRLSHYMKIVIDEDVSVDEEGSYLINIGYLRVSTDRQAEEGYGLEIQEEQILYQARHRGLKNLVLFIDDGYTGTNMDRPAFNGIVSLINSYNSGLSPLRINLLMVYCMNRLARSLVGILQFMQDYLFDKSESKSSKNNNRHGISFCSVEEPTCSFDRKNPLSTFLIGIFASMAEYDRDIIVSKMKKGMKQRAASGKWRGGGNRPYGYKYSREKGTLIVVPEEAKIIREIFRLYVEEKIPPQHISKMVGLSSDVKITNILKRKSLTGCVTFLGEEFPGIHEPIISLELWEAAQEELKTRSVHRAISHYLLSGLLYCGECGAKMRYQKWAKNGDCKIVCYSRQKSKPTLMKDPNCPSELFWAADIESAVVKQLFSMTYLGNKENVKTKESDIFDITNNTIKKEMKLLKAYYARHEKALLGESEEPLPLLEERIQEISKHIKTLEEQLSNIEVQKRTTKKVEKIKSVLDSLESNWPLMTEKEKQTVCRELIERIVVYSSGMIDVHLRLSNYFIKAQPEQ